jgi:ABC-2 type transport system ATP-binding protein
MIQPSVITVDGLNKQFHYSDTKTLDEVGFHILRGEKFGIFGPNGAGKTTLISILCGVLKPDTGSVTYHINADLPVKSVLQHVGYVPQEYAFFQELTPYQNLMYFGAQYAIPFKERRNRVQDLMKLLGLESVMHKKVKTFSGGMKRRLNLAIGIIHRPKILFLDEPTVGVDVQSKMAIMQYLDHLNREGATIIYTSHHLKEAEDFCDRILLLDSGRIAAFNGLEQLFEQYDVNDLETCFIKLTGTAYRDL